MESQRFHRSRKIFVASALTRLLMASLYSHHASSEETHFDVTMQGYQPGSDEDYVCTNVAVPISGHITAFIPLTSTDRIHHLGLHGCSNIVHPLNGLWNCDIYYSCVGQKPLFVWDHVGAFELPNNTGIPIGMDNGLGYVMMRIHYGRKFKGNIRDYSGVRLRISSKRPAYLAGAYFMFADWGNVIPADTKGVTFNLSCQYTLRTPLYMFAYRIHTHALGRMVSAYKYSKDGGGWTKLGAEEPRLTQRFITHENPILISTGDFVAAQCLYDSTGVYHATRTGIHDHNEMCGFYLHYYIKAEDEDVTKQFTLCRRKEFNIFDKYPTETLSIGSEMYKDPAMVAAHDKITFNIDESSIQLPSDVGRILNLAFDRNGNLFVLHMGDQRALRSDLLNVTAIRDNVVLKKSSHGNILGRWGKDMFYSPSGIFIDDDDCLWIADIKQKQVIKLNLTTNSSSMIQLISIAGTTDGQLQQHFCDPASIAVSSGIVFVADGCNAVESRISKFSSADGKPLGSWTFENRLAPNSLGTISGRSSISLDWSGRRIFFANSRSAEVRVFSFDGNSLGRIELLNENGFISDVSYCSKKNTLFLIAQEIADDKLSLVGRIFAYNASTYAAMYSWTPEEEALQQSRSILASDDCSKVLIGDTRATKLLQFDIYTNVTRGESGNSMSMDIGQDDDYDMIYGEVDWMATAILWAIVSIPVVCATALIYAVFRKRTCRVAAGPSRVKPIGFWRKYTTRGYRDHKGSKMLIANLEKECDSLLLLSDSSDEQDILQSNRSHIS